MKKTTSFVAAVLVSLSLVSCAGLSGLGTGANGSTTGNILSGLASAATNGNTLSNILTSFIGGSTVNANDIVGTWKYNQPGCAFTSQSALASAGGEVIATQVKEKLSSTYKTLGFKSSNTSFTFNADNTFSCTLLGKTLNGTYVLEPKTSAITLNFTMLGVQAYSLNGFVKKNGNGIGLLFESKKILGILQTVGAMSGNSTVSSLTSLTSNYDGVRIGFDMTK